MNGRAVDNIAGASAAERRKNAAHGVSHGFHRVEIDLAAEANPRLAPWAHFFRRSAAGHDSRRVRRRRGFTLVEVLVTLVLVGACFPVIMTGVTLSLHAADDARKKEEASGLAEQKLNELVESEGNGEAAATTGDFGADHAGFTWSADVSNVDTDLDQVTVRVSWNARGHQRGVSLSGFAYTGAGPNPNGSIGSSSTGGGLR